jgi:hypothetical protein
VQAMTNHTRTNHTRLAVPAVALLLGVAFSSPSRAQDGMQLDSMFKESLSQGRDLQQKREGEARPAQGRRYEGRDVPTAGRRQTRHVKRSEKGR